MVVVGSDVLRLWSRSYAVVTESAPARTRSCGTLDAAMQVHLSRPPLQQSFGLALGLWAGETPAGRDEAETQRRLRGFRREGIDFFVDLTEDGEAEPYAYLLHPWARHVRVPMRAGELRAAVRVREAIAVVDRALGDGFFVYVHGVEGVERTGIVVGCWLAYRDHHRGDPVAMLEELRSVIPGRRRASPRTAAGRALVRAWPPYGDGSGVAEARAALRVVSAARGGSR